MGEAVIVHYQSRDGANFMWMSPIIRIGDRVALADAIEWRDAPRAVWKSFAKTKKSA